MPTSLKKETVESDHVEVGENVEEVLESGEKKKQSTVSTEWINGVVALWKRSHGFIRFEEEDKESKRIFFHKSNVSTEDKKVHLRRGTEVRFHIESLDDGKTNAVDVQTRDGGPLNFHMKHG